MSAEERSRAQAELNARMLALDTIKRVSPMRWFNYASQNDLPTDYGRCSTEVLVKAARSLVPTTSLSGEGKPMALKTPAKKATPAAAPKSFLITYPVTKPNKATATVLVGEAPESADGVQQLVITSPTDLKGSPMPMLLALINAGRTESPIKKTTGEDAAISLAWDAILARAETPNTDGTPKAPAKPRVLKAVAYPSKGKDEIKAVGAGTKVSLAVDLLAQEGGVLLSELESELSKTGKPVSARAWLGYDVAKVVGYGVRSEPEGENDLRLFLVLPKGMKAPLAHKVKAEKPVVEKAEKPVVAAPKSAAKKAGAKPVEVEEVVEEEAPAPVAKSAPKPGREGKSAGSKGKKA
jgi:hypothetical protein